jgi:hypothetical protein
MPPFWDLPLKMPSLEAQLPSMDNNYWKFEQNQTSSNKGVLWTKSCANFDVFLNAPFLDPSLTTPSLEAQLPTMDNNHTKLEQNPSSSYGEFSQQTHVHRLMDGQRRLDGRTGGRMDRQADSNKKFDRKRKNIGIYRKIDLK